MKGIVWLTGGKTFFNSNGFEEYFPKAKEFTIDSFRFHKTLFAGIGLEYEYQLDIINKLNKGFKLLDKWDIAIPLNSGYPTLRELLTQRQLSFAEDYLPDTKILALCTNFIFWKRSEVGLKTYNSFLEFIKKTGSFALSFAIAVFINCPYIMVLPSSWAGLPEGGYYKGEKIYIKNISKQDIERAGRVFKAGKTTRLFLPISLMSEIKACSYLKVTK